MNPMEAGSLHDTPATTSMCVLACQICSKEGKRMKKRLAFLVAILACVNASVLTFGPQGAARSAAQFAKTATPNFRLALLSQKASVQAAGRGSPWINMSDGRDVLTDYSGRADLARLISENQAYPLAL